MGAGGLRSVAGRRRTITSTPARSMSRAARSPWPPGSGQTICRTAARGTAGSCRRRPSTAEDDHYFMISTISSGSRYAAALPSQDRRSDLDADRLERRSGRRACGCTWRRSTTAPTMARLYLNGQPVGSVAKTGTLTGDPSVPVWVGGNPTDPAGKPWDGRIDDVRIYDRALSATEIQALPPSSAERIFGDGFESGTTAGWDASVGVVDVLAAAARIGARGARVKAGTSCTGPDQLILPPPPIVQELHEACREIQVGAVEVIAPGGEFRAGETISLGNGFSASGDLTVTLDSQLTPVGWLRDDSPNDESSYTAEFHLNLDSLTLGAGDRVEHFVAADATAESSFALVLQSDGGGGGRSAARSAARRWHVGLDFQRRGGGDSTRLAARPATVDRGRRRRRAVPVVGRCRGDRAHRSRQFDAAGRFGGVGRGGRAARRRRRHSRR